MNMGGMHKRGRKKKWNALVRSLLEGPIRKEAAPRITRRKQREGKGQGVKGAEAMPEQLYQEVRGCSAVPQKRGKKPRPVDP